MTTDNFNIILHANSSNQESQRIDGLDGIVKKGDEFIKKVVENSYFFDNIIVKERQNLLSELRHQNIGIPARKTTKNAKNPDYWHSEDKGNRKQYRSARRKAFDVHTYTDIRYNKCS